MSMNKYLGLDRPIMFKSHENGVGIITTTSDVNKYSAMRKKIIDNCEAYVHWLLGVVKKYVVSPPKGKKWSALCLYMNQKNIEYLHSQLESFVWLDVAPTCCRELADDEYGVDPKNIITDTP